MAIRDLINNYGNGATGSFTDNAGKSIGYTISSRGNPTVNWDNMTQGARFYAQSGLTPDLGVGDPLTITFDQPVAPGLGVRMDGMQNNAERLSFEINGTHVNLQTLINNGDAYLRDQGAIYGGDLATDGGVFADATIIFTIPIQSLRLTAVDGGGAIAWFAADLVLDDSTPVCFVRGTLIETPDGPRLIEELAVGDEALTLDNGCHPIRWIGKSVVLPQLLSARPKLWPIRIRSGALGQGLPRRDLMVSRQHRILLRAAAAKAIFGVQEVLLPANKLLPLDGVEQGPDDAPVEYIHILLDTHEVVFAEGLPAETLFLGDRALAALSPAARREIEALFPELDGPAAMTAYHMPERGHDMKRLVALIGNQMETSAPPP